MMKFSNPRNNNKNRPFKRNNNHHRRQGDSNSGPKVSGNLTTVLEKYKNLAKDATSAGDYIAAENYLQHAEHFVRVLNERNLTHGSITGRLVSKDEYMLKIAKEYPETEQDIFNFLNMKYLAPNDR